MLARGTLGAISGGDGDRPGSRQSRVLAVAGNRRCQRDCEWSAARGTAIITPMRGFDDLWRAVIVDFVERASFSGLRISINDGGALPDMVHLRLMQSSA